MSCLHGLMFEGIHANRACQVTSVIGGGMRRQMALQCTSVREHFAAQGTFMQDSIGMVNNLEEQIIIDLCSYETKRNILLAQSRNLVLMFGPRGGCVIASTECSV